MRLLFRILTKMEIRVKFKTAMMKKMMKEIKMKRTMMKKKGKTKMIMMMNYLKMNLLR